ncbi:MAG TPA: hypothetical protein VMU75_08725 [Acidimicrobiales bacterium]|nr:hypothetical protein [Acidimicrobiales bacterium]
MPRHRAYRARALLAVLVLLVAGAAAAALGRGAVAASVPPARPLLEAPGATSISTAGGTWASLPMGHLDEPLGTFWQLFELPSRTGAHWTDRAASLAVATNGGLDLATPGGSSLVVGVRPSNRLDFSPLVATPNGTSWSPIPPASALGTGPDALAAAPGGRELALANGGRAPLVQALGGSGSAWHTLVTQASLAGSSAGRRCGVTALTAVAYGPTGAALVGAACDRPGVVGVFGDGPAGWHLAGPALPRDAGAARVEVVRLARAGTGVDVLLALSDRSSGRLLVAWSGLTQARWSTSPAIDLARSERLVSVGPAAGLGEFALVGDASGRERAEIVTGPGTPWQALPPPPAATATLAFGPRGRVDALAVNDTVLSDWTLAPTRHSWTRTAVVRVPIEFGSSG